MNLFSVNGYLLASASGLLIIALTYGAAPQRVLPKIVNITVEGRDLTHIFRAVMGLYSAFALLWIFGAFTPDLTRTALISEIVFMTGLASGRVLSLLLDGRPSAPLIAYLILEVVSAAIGFVFLLIG